jgi:uncharacterized protein (TIGR02145 family)
MKTLALLSLIIILLLFFGCHDAELGPNTNNQNSIPKITRISPDSAYIGDIVIISGSGFGSSPNSSYISFNSTTTTQSVSWIDTDIKVQVPVGATDGNVCVSVNNNISNGICFKVLGVLNGTVTDIDGNIYKIVKIGSQIWMAENLKVSHYRNGDTIPEETDQTIWGALTTGAWCYYNNSDSFGVIYGKLYNWYAVIDSRGLAPAGWHVPSDSEWTVLSTYLGGDSFSGGKLKEAGMSHWNSPNTGATNISGFTALPGGWRYNNGIFLYIDYDGHWWSISEDDGYYAWGRHLNYDITESIRNNFDKEDGFSIRCIKDN